MMPKVGPSSCGFTPSAASNRVQVPQSKNSKNRLLKTMPAGSQWPHSIMNCRRLTKLVIGSVVGAARFMAAGSKPGSNANVKRPLRAGLPA